MSDDKLRAVQIGCGDRAPAHIAAMLDCGAIASHRASGRSRRIQPAH